MPPKKKKPSKKDQAEAEELRKRQEEEARQKELQAKRERELYEKQQREALDVLFKEQAPSLQQEEQQLQLVIATLRQRWLDLAQKRREAGDVSEEPFIN